VGTREEEDVTEIIEGLSFEEYERLEGLRASDLKLLRRSPAHWVAARKTRRDSPDLEFGRAFHAAMEDPKTFRDRIVVEPEFSGRTKDGKESTRSAEAREKREAWLADLRPGTTVLKAEDARNLTGMIEACQRHKLVSRLFESGRRELTIQVSDPETGLVLKCRPDFISDGGFVVDLKSTRDASHGFFTREIFSDRGSDSRYYVLQASHYAHCCRLTKRFRSDHFVFVAVEKTEPWGVRIYSLDEAALEVGERERSRVTRLYAECLRKNEWPCYDEHAEQVVIPQWVRYVEDGE